VLDNMLQMICHPDTPAKTVTGVEVATEFLADGTLGFRFCVDGVLNMLETLGPVPPARTDGLWKTTCFEVFLRKSGDIGYCEYNFAPSGAWASYQFDDYRQAMRILDLDETPEILLDASETHLAAEVTITVPAHILPGPIDLNLAAVIEETDGTKSYWALAHPPGKPDFHDKDCFALTLSAPEAL
jgi:hypothetical protein